VPVVELTLNEMDAWARQYVASLTLPAFIAIRGDLGAGKTTLVQAMARALGVTDEVTSPTYALVHEYHSPRGVVQHLDLYRLKDASQLAQLGWEDIVRGNGIVFLEWPERVDARELPAHHVSIQLSHVANKPDVRSLQWA
jgi:tRNA threonylcarbamoyladenosine biosynthesis protein TsaE